MTENINARHKLNHETYQKLKKGINSRLVGFYGISTFIDYLILFIYILAIFHNLPRLRTSNVDRSNERKWLYPKKGKKQTLPHKNYYRLSLRG